ncbi:uncharacterized protein MYCFIDRAFT_209536 [Pseudocercospora fijiensis CIRAD86]|uniref:Uncharacterized protein n=1 Tax=Pseudocercospora fijiensis (strain CIRAD86) TaxID=383855 RepID=N1Q5Z9_PSEFD|nr:uncharacterized protein MYCFIDRAFT_209536 [Pseudocercospora fijiensis CIRAD86]EME87555.1 hypothetical protein MYCFIDRAFT_209536 [Pseudocercospora fijiensis CIRAD86]
MRSFGRRSMSKCAVAYYRSSFRPADRGSGRSGSKFAREGARQRKTSKDHQDYRSEMLCALAIMFGTAFVAKLGAFPATLDFVERVLDDTWRGLRRLRDDVHCWAFGTTWKEHQGYIMDACHRAASRCP